MLSTYLRYLRRHNQVELRNLLADAPRVIGSAPLQGVSTLVVSYLQVLECGAHPTARNYLEEPTARENALGTDYPIDGTQHRLALEAFVGFEWSRTIGKVGCLRSELAPCNASISENPYS